MGDEAVCGRYESVRRSSGLRLERNRYQISKGGHWSLDPPSNDAKCWGGGPTPPKLMCQVLGGGSDPPQLLAPTAGGRG